VEYASPPKRRIIEETDRSLPRRLGETEITNNDGAEDLPMRWLTDFTILDQLTQTPLSLFELDREPDDSALNIDYVFTATGTVMPDFADEEDEEPNDIDADGIDSDSDDSSPPDQLSRVRVNLSVIWYVHVGYESKIYLRTEFAWYILGTPSRQYAPLYEPYWIRHRLVSLVCNTLDQSQDGHNKRMDYPAFINSLEVTETCPDDIVEAMQVGTLCFIPSQYLISRYL
jgi:DNA (cytosine-5)-methyltransferase 1